MTVFAADRNVLQALFLMLAVEGECLRVSWSPGAGLAPVGGREPRTEEEWLQRLVAEFDAELLSKRQAALLLEGVEDEVPRPELVSFDFEARDYEGWVRMVQRMSEDRDVVLAAASRRRRGHGSCARAGVLWARVESKREAANLERFRPRPTLLLREGSSCRMVALWSLRRPLGYEWVLRANKRIAHRLFAAKKWADLEFVFPCPGSCLRAGRARPVPVRVVRFEPVIFEARQVVGGLRDAPDPGAWREAA